MATWADRRDAYNAEMRNVARQDEMRRRAEQERNALAEVLRGSYEPAQEASPAVPYVDEQAQAMGLEQPQGLVAQEARQAKQGGFNMQNALAGLMQAGRVPEAMQLQSMMKTAPDQWEQIEGPRGTVLQRNKTTGELKSVIGTPERMPDWMMPGYVKAQREIAQAKNEGKPAKLPTPALKLQQEELDAIATSANIAKDLAAIKTQVDSGDLKLGLMANLASQGRNIVGISDESSRKFSTFRATLERMRNDSLRLNKGVQTEGDAQRAWNELIANINDHKLVSARLEEISKINERAANIRKLNVDNIRQNFGLDPMDVSGYESQPSPFGADTQSPAYNIPKGAKTGTDEQGRKVFSTDGGKTVFDATSGKRIK